MKTDRSAINRLIAIDKPLGITSQGAVSRIRRALGVKKVGHAGTLDPAATGVLVVGVGQATRLLGLLTLDEKGYEARIAFGAETATDDAEGEVTRTAATDASLLDPAFAERTVASLVGKCDQVPPAFSAISVDGRRSYDRARAGEAVDLPPRHVEIYESRLIAVEGTEDEPVWRCAFRVSKGTYIRAIARDLGRSVGSAAHLAGLVRTASGSVGLDACAALDGVAQRGTEALDICTIDPARALSLPVRLIDEREMADVACGRRIPSGLVLDLSGAADGLREPRGGERVSLVRGDRLYGVWSRHGDVLCSEATFPEGIEGVRP